MEGKWNRREYYNRITCRASFTFMHATQSYRLTRHWYTLCWRRTHIPNTEWERNNSNVAANRAPTIVQLLQLHCTCECGRLPDSVRLQTLFCSNFCHSVFIESFAIASTVNELLISHKHCGVEKQKNGEELHAMTDIATKADHQLHARFLTMRSFLHIHRVVLILHSAKLWLRRCFLSRYGHAIRIASPHISIHVFCWCWHIVEWNGRTWLKL